MNEDMIREIVRDEISKSKKQQFTFPLDIVSQGIIHKNLPVFQNNSDDVLAIDGYITFKINGQLVRILTGS